MDPIEKVALQLQSEFLSRIDKSRPGGRQCWQLFCEIGTRPLDFPGETQPADSLLITFGYETLAQEKLTLKLVRQLLLGDEESLESGVQLQCRLQYEPSTEQLNLKRRLKELTRLGSWAFPSPTAFLEFAQEFPAFQLLLDDFRPVIIEVIIDKMAL